MKLWWNYYLDHIFSNFRKFATCVYIWSFSKYQRLYENYSVGEVQQWYSVSAIPSRGKWRASILNCSANRWPSHRTLFWPELEIR